MAKKVTQLQELDKWKVGQKVRVHSFGCMQHDCIKHIERITDGRDGTIYVDGTAYNRRGHQRGQTGWHGSYISVASNEDIQQVRGEICRQKLKKFPWHKLSDDEAINIYKNIKEKVIKD